MTLNPPPSPNDRRLLLLSPKDNVLVLTATIQAGESVLVEGQTVRFPRTLPLGHKIARRPLAPGETISKYGAPIGSATAAIPLAEHVHTHNVKSDYLPTYTLENQRSFVRDPR